MRRSEPRPLAAAAERVAAVVAPFTPLARVQRAWAASAGEAVRREAQPVAERAGVVTVACRSAAWAHELKLMSRELSRRLNEYLEHAGQGTPVKGLRFVTSSLAGPPEPSARDSGSRA